MYCIPIMIEHAMQLLLGFIMASLIPRGSGNETTVTSKYFFSVGDAYLQHCIWVELADH